jgi:hypothetical protein
VAYSCAVVAAESVTIAWRQSRGTVSESHVPKLSLGMLMRIVHLLKPWEVA